MAMLTGYSPQYGASPTNTRSTGQTNTTYADPILDPKNQFHIRQPVDLGAFKYGRNRGLGQGTGQTSPAPTPIGANDLYYGNDTGSYQLNRPSVGTGAPQVLRNFSLSGNPIYAPIGHSSFASTPDAVTNASGAVNDPSKVQVRTQTGQYDPYYSLAETGQPQYASHNASGTDQYGRPSTGVNYSNFDPSQGLGGSENVMAYFIQQLLSRAGLQGSGGGQGPFDWTGLQNSLNTFPQGSDVGALLRSFGIS